MYCIWAFKIIYSKNNINQVTLSLILLKEPSIVLIFVSKGMIQRFGWLTCAIITPLVLLGTAVLFFSYLLFGDFSNLLMA